MGVSRNWVTFLRGLFLLLLICRSSGAEVITVDVRAAKNLLESGYAYLDVRYAVSIQLLAFYFLILILVISFYFLIFIS